MKEYMEFPIQIKAIHSRIVPNGYSVSPHIHNFYQLYYVREGSSNYCANQQEYLLNHGDCMLVKPGVLREVINIHKKVNYVVIGFEVEGVYIPDFTIEKIHLGPNLKQDADLLMQEVEKPSFYYSSVLLHTMLNRIVLELYQILEAKVHGVNKYRQKKELVEAVDQYLALNLANPISRADVSGYSGYSPVHVARLFKGVMGKTIVERLTELRLQESERLLVNSDIPITEIALSVGFNSFSHFTQLFKRNTGLSPSEYRKKRFM